MPGEAAAQGSGVTLTGVTLHHAHFADRFVDDAARALAEGAGFSLDLAVARTSPRRLSVAITLTGGTGLPYDLSVTYAAHFEMRGSVPRERWDAEWRDAAYVRAPAILFPYLREIVWNLTSRWWKDAEPLLLPADPDLLRFAREQTAGIPPPPDGNGNG